ncbi:hypothetical protein Mapa_006211 [Marchantia paleacea]|nr:hypothetical protein Mapa_006211 [Marchantia paleacea]
MHKERQGITRGNESSRHFSELFISYLYFNLQLYRYLSTWSAITYVNRSCLENCAL